MTAKQHQASQPIICLKFFDEEHRPQSGQDIQRLGKMGEEKNPHSEQRVCD